MSILLAADKSALRRAYARTFQRAKTEGSTDLTLTIYQRGRASVEAEHPEDAHAFGLFCVTMSIVEACDREQR